MPEVTLTIGCRLENLAFGSAAARGVVAEHLGAAIAAEVEIAITEVCSNIVRHGHPDEPDHEFTIKLRGCEHTIEIDIRDVGAEFPFEPRAMPAVDVALDDLPEGGFGLALVHQLMDVVEYRHVDGVNVIRLVKAGSRDWLQPS